MTEIPSRRIHLTAHAFRAILFIDESLLPETKTEDVSMILDRVRGDIFAAPQKHIAFAVNTQGYNDAGFAGQVSSRVWPELENTGGNELGEVLKHPYGTKTYHALVCHSLDGGGWDETPRVAKECLDKLDVPDDEEIAVVLMGSGPVGMMQGANVEAILAGMETSKKKLVVYTR